MNRRSLLPISLLAALSLVSCWHPIFDEQVSAGALFYDRIGSPFRTIGPVSLYSDILDGNFLPERNIDPQNGFWVNREPAGLSLNYIEQSGSSYRLSDASGFTPTSGGLADFARSGAFTTAPLLLTIVGNGSVVGSFQQLQINLGSPDSFGPQLVPGISGGVTKIAAIGATQIAGSTNDKIAVIYYDAAKALSVQSFDLTTSLGNEGTKFALNPGAHALAPFGRAFLKLSTGPTYDALYYWGGGSTVLRWDWAVLGSAPATIQVLDPLVAVLSDGTLVCQGKDWLDAYRSDGSKIFSLPAGSVRFVHEVDYLGTSYCIFAQKLIAPPKDNSGNHDVYIALWRLPTSSFAGLGK